MDRLPARPDHRLLAVLGPTNTGKTYFAVERMIAHRSGMIGFPLRLLARENYDRIVAIKGTPAVALITGEEKIVPPEARYFVCTVESMPLGRRVECLAVDEVQLAADPERGHVFTDRILHARGDRETLLLGAETIRPVLQRLLPDAEFVSRPRFSRLAYAGPKKIVRLPRRSAAVAFSANDVYAIAEMIRRQRGGAAIVMGALSPRTRNAQVALYQAGDVDYLVATDAIGMGLNMDLDHVALAATVKFDGQRRRRLSAAEIGQIAGRAGRHMSDGTFGTTGGASALDAETIDAVEDHRFPKLAEIFWRNRDLDFADLDRLIQSLGEPPVLPGLMRAPESTDVETLKAAAQIDDIARLAKGEAAVRLLWDVCQLPEFHKTMADTHVRTVGEIFRQLRGRNGAVDPSWLAKQVERLDRPDGDIETLMTRLSQIRTWTYVTHRPDWMMDTLEWQARTRTVENSLSDALHDALMQRFVDKRTSVLMRQLRNRDDLVAAVTPSGEIVIEGTYIGRIDGFRFAPDPRASYDEARSLLRAARPALASEIRRRVYRLLAGGDDGLALATDGSVSWRGGIVGSLVKGPDALSPRIEIDTGDLMDAADRDRVARHVRHWLESELRRQLPELHRLKPADGPSAVRGFVYRLVENLGTLSAPDVIEGTARLTAEEKKALGKAGIRYGRKALFAAGSEKPPGRPLRAMLWRLYEGRAFPVTLPSPGEVAMTLEPDLAHARDPALARALNAIGFVRAGPVALRADIANRVAAALFAATRQGEASLPDDAVSSIGIRKEALEAFLLAFGFATRLDGEGRHLISRRLRRRRSTEKPAIDPRSPFAALAALRPGRRQRKTRA